MSSPSDLSPDASVTLSRRGLAALALVLVLASTTTGALGATAATLWVLPPPAAAQVSGPPATSGSTNIAGAVFAQVQPAVVQVVASGQVGSGPMRSGSGSGVVVDARGLVLTNQHVVDNARAVSIRFNGGVTREAQVLGTDRGNDLALLKVDLPSGTPAAALGDSDRVEVGELAIAIGSPFGLEHTVTQGIISAVQRTWTPGNGRTRRNLLQTDAPINPGNSGGPLLNARGEVIGINTMIESPVRGSVGIGFAVPINAARRLMPQLESGAQLRPVWLGISGRELDPAIARDQGLPVQEGILVASVVPGAPAAQAGVRGGQGANERIPRGGDVILAVDGAPVTSMAQLAERLGQYQPGDTARLTLHRPGVGETHLVVTLQAWPDEA